MLGRSARRLRDSLFRTVVLISIYYVEPDNVYEYAYAVDVKYVSTGYSKGPHSHEELGRAIVNFKQPHATR